MLYGTDAARGVGMTGQKNFAIGYWLLAIGKKQRRKTSSQKICPSSRTRYELRGETGLFPRHTASPEGAAQRPVSLSPKAI